MFEKQIRHNKNKAKVLLKKGHSKRSLDQFLLSFVAVQLNIPVTAAALTCAMLSSNPM